MKRIIVLSASLVLGLAVSAQAAGMLPPADQRFKDSTTAEVPSFQRHVLPLMGRLGCNGRACHGSFQGQGGFRLSLFGYDFKMDHEALLKGDNPRVDLKAPRESLMLTKPVSTDPDEHGGGHRVDVDSWQYRILLRWIEAGAVPTDEEKDPTFVRLEVAPTEIVFKQPGEKAQLKVVSHWSDGTVEDVTPLCRFQTNDDAVAKVDEAGQITVVGKGDTHIVAFYDNGVVPVPVLLPVTDQNGSKYPNVPTPTKIDELVVQKLRKLGVVPSDVCSDEEFLRRVSLDITGALPKAEEVTAFVADKSADKRTKKVDELLSRPAYAAWWATKFCDILGNSENQLRINNGYTGDLSGQWYRWMYARVAENMPYDDLVEGIVLAKGRSSEDQTFTEYCQEMNSYLGENAVKAADRETMPHYWARRNMRKPNERALSFSYAMLGVRLQCAECHKHPFDQWSQQDFQHFTAFFNRISYGPADRTEYNKMMEDIGVTKGMNNGERQRLIAKAIKEGKLTPAEEVYITPAPRSRAGKDDKGKATGAGRVITPKVLGGEEVVDANYADPRQPLMDWLREKDNPYFARAIVNRVWSHYFNMGIVEPADDMNLANAPSNRELLDWLAASFVEHDYDLKWLHRTIVGSRTYQASWKPNATNELDLKNFSHNIPRRLPAEVVYDAVIAATAGPEELSKRGENPVEMCSIGMGRGYTQRNSGNNYALSVFGKPKRETPCDCERSNEPSLLQTVFLRNDREMFTLIDRRGGWLSQLTGRVEKDEKADKETSRKLGELSTMLKSVDRKLEGLRKEKKPDAKRIAELERERSRLRAKLQDLQPKEEPQVASVATDNWVEQAYLRTFNRRPTQEELDNGKQYLATAAEPAEGLRDLVWALLNSKEFVVNH